jgi:hypothetical protein
VHKFSSWSQRNEGGWETAWASSTVNTLRIFIFVHCLDHDLLDLFSNCDLSSLDFWSGQCSPPDLFLDHGFFEQMQILLRAISLYLLFIKILISGADKICVTFTNFLLYRIYLFFAKILILQLCAEAEFMKRQFR